MTSLPGYDNWLTHNPDDDRCEHCGALPSSGWEPSECTGECGVKWRDPDAEYERRRDEAEQPGTDGDG